MSTTTSWTEYYGTYYITYTQTCTDAVAAVAGTPAVVEDFSTYTWDAGARSAETFLDIGHILLPSPNNPKGTVIGLNNVNKSTLYSEIKHGFYFLSDQYWIVVNGAKVGAARPATPAAICTVAISAGVVYYVYDGAVVYTTSSLFAPSTRIFADVSIYGPGDSVGCVYLEQYTLSADSSGSLDSTAVPVQEAGILMQASSSMPFPDIEGEQVLFVTKSEMRPIASFPGELVAGMVIETTSQFTPGSQPLLAAPFGEVTMQTSSTIRAAEYSTIVSYLPAMTGVSYEYELSLGLGDVTLPAMTSFSTAGFETPTLQGANYFISAFQTAAYSMTGGVISADYDLPSLGSLSSDAVYGGSSTTLPMLETLAVEFPFLSGVMYTEFEPFSFSGYITEEPESGLIETLTSNNFTFSGVMGDEMKAVSPEFTFTGDMTFPIIGRAEIGFGFNVTTSVTVETVATAYLVAKMQATLLSYSGNGLSVIAPQFTASANVISGAVAEVYVAFGATADIEVTAEDYARAQIIMPEVASVWGSMYVEYPQFTLNVEGSEVVVRPTMAYVSHLSADAEMTAYTGYDFDSVVYFKGHYYGIKADGMYLLEGANDGGVNIDVDVKTQEFDFDTARKKRIPYLYAGSDNVFNVTAFVDGVNYGTYPSTKGEERVYLPQGATGRYWQFEYQNLNGNNFALDSVDIVVNTLRRKV